MSLGVPLWMNGFRLCVVAGHPRNCHVHGTHDRNQTDLGIYHYVTDVWTPGIPQHCCLNIESDAKFGS